MPTSWYTVELPIPNRYETLLKLTYVDEILPCFANRFWIKSVLSHYGISLGFQFSWSLFIIKSSCRYLLWVWNCFFIVNLWTIKTRGQKGHCRSPEYNQRFKNLTSEWNQKQQHFILHVSRSLLCIRFVAITFWAEEVFEMCHLLWWIGQGGNFYSLFGPKNTNLVEDVENLLSVKFRWILFSGFRGKFENVSANNRPGQPFCFPIHLKNTNLVEGVEILLPIKFCRIPFRGQGGHFAFSRLAWKTQTW